MPSRVAIHQRPSKPYPTYPLTPHARGWAKKVKGKMYIIAPYSVGHEEALRIFYRKASKLGLTTEKDTTKDPIKDTTAPPPSPVSAAKVHSEPVADSVPRKVGPSVKEIKDKYLATKKRELAHGLISPRTYGSIREYIEPFAAAVSGPVSVLTPDDFGKYRMSLVAKNYGSHALTHRIGGIRTMFKWAYENEMLARLPRYGASFEKPPQKAKRIEKKTRSEKNGKRLFTPSQVRSLLGAAEDKQLKAMIYLAINFGIGNEDVSRVPISSIDFDTGMIDYARAKTGEERRAYLWPETISAVKDAVRVRSYPADSTHAGRVFIHRDGHPWVRTWLKGAAGEIEVDRLDSSSDEFTVRKNDRIATAFRDVMRAAGIVTDSIRREGLNYYALRHTYRTLADATHDQHAVMRSMGHSFRGVNGNYVQEISDARLKHVSLFVRSQVLGEEDYNTIAVSSL